VPLLIQIPDNVKMQQDVVVALMRSSTLFISHLGECREAWLMTAAAAHDQALSRSGKGVTPADVLKAIAELDFGPADALIPLLERELSGRFTARVSLTTAYRTLNQSKKSRKSEA
jgi:DNA polymerase epsilon subunit 3